MRILLIGDIVGQPGYRFVERALPGLREREKIDVVVANAENSASGSGISPKIFHRLRNAGVDCITMGDHIYRRKEAQPLYEQETRIVKPANFPPEAPGKPWTSFQCGDVEIAVFSLLGRVFMRPVDCPWRAADRILAELPPHIRVILLDFHAEATSDKQLMGRYLDGRVSAVVGTHTHVPTADECILPGGTAFQCDLGMTGPYESILGRQIEPVSKTTRTFEPTYFHVATGDVRLAGAIVDIDPASGRAAGIRRICLRASDLNDSPNAAP